MDHFCHCLLICASLFSRLMMNRKCVICKVYSNVKCIDKSFWIFLLKICVQKIKRSLLKHSGSFFTMAFPPWLFYSECMKMPCLLRCRQIQYFSPKFHFWTFDFTILLSKTDKSTCSEIMVNFRILNRNLNFNPLRTEPTRVGLMLLYLWSCIRNSVKSKEPK